MFLAGVFFGRCAVLLLQFSQSVKSYVFVLGFVRSLVFFCDDDE